MFRSSYHRSSNSEMVGLVQDIARMAEDIRKLDVTARRRGNGHEDPLTTVLSAGQQALLRDLIQHVLNERGRIMMMQEGRRIAEEKVRLIAELIADTRRYQSGTGSEVDYVLAQAIQLGIQEIMGA